MLGRFLKIVLTLVVFSAVVWGGYKAYKTVSAGATVAIQVRTGTVEKNDVIQRVSFSGHTFPLRSSVINPPFDGYVKTLFVKVGQKVKRNDPLITIAENLNAEAHDLFPIRSPFTGTVVQVLVSEGQNVSKTQGNYDGTNALLRVDDLTQMFVQAEVPEVEYANVKPGQEATIKAPAIIDQEFTGSVIEKALAPTSQDRWSRNNIVFPVRLKVNELDPQLKSGMTVIVDIVVAERKGVLTLKHEFVEHENNQYFVKKVDGGRIAIKIGIQDDTNVEVLEGLSLGDKIEQVDFLAVH